MKVPNLIGKPAEEVKRLLFLSGLNLGKETYEDRDSIQYMCVKGMSPGLSSGTVKPGTYIDITYHSNRTMDFKKEMKTLLHEDSLVNVPQAFEIDTLIEENIETTDFEENYEDDF